jgi:hypothetical protein
MSCVGAIKGAFVASVVSDAILSYLALKVLRADFSRFVACSSRLMSQF